jgi:hypothetical protein
MPKPLQFLLNGTDITDSVYEAVIEKQEKRGADKCEFKVARTVSVSIGDDCKVKELVGNTFIFGGKVIEVSNEYAISKCVALSYGKELDEIRIFPSKIYTSSSPESIVSNLITTYTSLTPSTGVSGVTIGRYEASGLLIDNIKALADIAGFDFWTEVTTTGVKQFNFKVANINLGKTLYLGVVGANNPNAFRESYEKDDSLIYNAVEVYGRNKSETVRYRYDQTGIYGSFYFPRVLSSVGVKIRDSILTEGVDFEYRPESKLLFLNTSYTSSSSAPAKLEIDSVVDNTPLVYGEDATSISTYGKRGVAVILESESSVTDLQSFLTKFLSIYSKPRTTLKVKKPGLDFGIKNGGFVTVHDPFLGISGQNFVVRVVRWLYPQGMTEMILDSFEPELYEFQRNVKFNVEKSARSLINLRDIGIVEKKFYFSGSAAPFSLVERPQDVVAGNSAFLLTTATPAFMRIRLQVVGATTKDFNLYSNATTTISSQSATPIPFYSETLPITPTDVVNADSSNNITVNVQVYGSSAYGGTQNLIAPSTSSTQFFTITLSGMLKQIPSTLGMVLYVRYSAADGGYQIQWSGDKLCGIFCLGFKKL